MPNRWALLCRFDPVSDRNWTGSCPHVGHYRIPARLGETNEARAETSGLFSSRACRQASDGATREKRIRLGRRGKQNHDGIHVFPEPHEARLVRVRLDRATQKVSGGRRREGGGELKRHSVSLFNLANAGKHWTILPLCRKVKPLRIRSSRRTTQRNDDALPSSPTVCH